MRTDIAELKPRFDEDAAAAPYKSSIRGFNPSVHHLMQQAPDC
jgi:hypothetical protein